MGIKEHMNEYLEDVEMSVKNMIEGINNAREYGEKLTCSWPAQIMREADFGHMANTNEYEIQLYYDARMAIYTPLATITFQYHTPVRDVLISVKTALAKHFLNMKPKNT